MLMDQIKFDAKTTAMLTAALMQKREDSEYIQWDWLANPEKYASFAELKEEFNGVDTTKLNHLLTFATERIDYLKFNVNIKPISERVDEIVTSTPLGFNIGIDKKQYDLLHRFGGNPFTVVSDTHNLKFKEVIRFDDLTSFVYILSTKVYQYQNDLLKKSLGEKATAEQIELSTHECLMDLFLESMEFDILKGTVLIHFGS